MKPFAHTAAVVGSRFLLLVALAQPAWAQLPTIPQQGCGNENETPCPYAGGDGGYTARCDTGLHITGGIFRGFRCTNLKRRQPEVDLGFVGGWADWALKNQRELAQDEPLNWVMHIATHNSYNTWADGHALIDFPNQIYSTTDQLRAGARAITFDNYYINSAARLCHSASRGSANELCKVQVGNYLYLKPPSMRYYSNGIKEIRNWLDQNPNEIVIVDFEEYVPLMAGGTNVDEAVLAPIRAYLGDMVLSPPPVPPKTPSGVFPNRWPTRREMLNAGKRVIVLDNDYTDFKFAQRQTDGTYSPSEFLFNEHETLADGYNSTDSPWLAKNQRRFPDCFKTPDFTQDFKKTLFTKATIVVEERETGESIFGLMSDGGIVDATECNYSIIVLDKYSQALEPPDGSYPVFPGYLPTDYLIYTQKPDFHRQDLAVWSWKPFDRGQYGDCAMLEGQFGRWASATCSNQAKFACAKPRSQSGKDPLQWQDPLGDDWRVTSATGSWDVDVGQSTCQAEFGPDFVFSVPVNGYQNRRLKDAGTATDNIWLNYRQHNDDKWVIGGSSAPVAKAGPNQVVECGNSVNLDADGSYSRDGGTLSYKWQGPFGIRTTQIVNLATPGDLPLGVDPILLAVTDSNGQTATDSLTVTVQDTTPPSLTVSLSTGSAPRHSRFVPVRATITSKDSCDSEPPSIALLSIELAPEKDHDKDHDKDHEKDHGKDHEKDHDRIVTYFRDAQFGTDDRTFELARGEEHDRTYIVTYSATDLSGNVTKISAQVVVEEAHDD